MKGTRLLGMILAVALVTAGALAGPATAKAKKKKSGPVVVGTDAEGDWGANVDATLAPLGAQLGQDLVEAAIGVDGKNINFIIKVSSLPAVGGMPEATRYTWELSVGDDFVELDGKYSNYSRGACDPTSGACPPPRDPGMQPFLVRGNCVNATAAVTCEELGIVNATFDAATGTITIPVPAAMIGAKPGTKIASATQPDSGFSGVNAAPSAFFSHSSAPYDNLTPPKVFVVPGGKK